MGSGGLAESVFRLGCAAVLVAFIFLCLFGKKPIAGMPLPYRWGTWKGIVFGCLAVIFLANAMEKDFTGSPASITKLLIRFAATGVLSFAFTVVSVGLLRRRKYAVVAHFILEG